MIVCISKKARRDYANGVAKLDNITRERDSLKRQLESTYRDLVVTESEDDSLKKILADIIKDQEALKRSVSTVVEASRG